MIDGATSLAARIRAGEVSAREAVDQCLAAINAVNGELNAVVWLVPDRARESSPSLCPAPRRRSRSSPACSAATAAPGCGASLEAVGTTEPSPLITNMLRLGAMTFLDRFDVVLSPVAGVPALPHGTTFENISQFGFVCSHNLTGWPAAVVRAGTSPEGLPIGVQIAAGPWREDRTLAVARHLESVLGPFPAPTIAA